MRRGSSYLPSEDEAIAKLRVEASEDPIVVAE